MKFSATIIIIGVNPNVIVPADILADLFKNSGKKSAPIQVNGKLNGADYLANVVKYQGEFRLYLNNIMLKNSGLKLGDLANVEIEFDPKPRIEKIPPKLAELLARNPVAQKNFDLLPPSRQKEILRYLNNLKTEETLNKNIEIVIKHLSGQPQKMAYLPKLN